MDCRAFGWGRHAGDLENVLVLGLHIREGAEVVIPMGCGWVVGVIR